MTNCHACGLTLFRVHRRAAERILFAAAYRCRGCGRRTRRLHRHLAIRFGYFSLHTRCSHCGTADVHRVSKLDRAEPVSRRIASRLQRLTAAPLNWCGACRLQYYDWRPAPPTHRAPDRLHTPGELTPHEG
jgi:uncharacterized protein with PIN domain